MNGEEAAAERSHAAERGDAQRVGGRGGDQWWDVEINKRGNYSAARHRRRHANVAAPTVSRCVRHRSDDDTGMAKGPVEAAVPTLAGRETPPPTRKLLILLLGAFRNQHQIHLQNQTVDSQYQIISGFVLFIWILVERLMTSKRFTMATIALWYLRLRTSRMRLWMNNCSFTQRVLNIST